MAKLKAGTIVTLQVERDSPFGFFLSDGQTDVLLHTSESTDEVRIGSMLDVYLYHDHENRLAATLKKPLLQLEESGSLIIADINPKLGFFLENGTPRHILLPISELSDDKEVWPKRRDRLFVYVGHDKQERLLAYLLQEDDLAEISQDAEGLKVNQTVTVTITRVSEIGAFIITEKMVMGLIHQSEMTRKLRQGETLHARITFIRDDGRINASMRPLKEESRDIDADRIYRYIKQQGGSMPFGDKSSPEDIEAGFQMSKASFKRALGKLIKARLIEQKDGITSLIE